MAKVASWWWLIPSLNDLISSILSQPFPQPNPPGYTSNMCGNTMAYLRKSLPDRGPQFVAEFTRELYRLLGIKLAATTAYHPQGDGQTERVNQELEQYLRVFINQRQTDWDELLPFAESQYNNHIHSATRQVPFLLDTGRVPRMGFEPGQRRSHLESVNEFKERMKDALDEAKAALTQSKDDMARYYDRNCIPAPDYQPGDKVYLDASDIQTTRPCKKLSHRHLGPFEVVRKVGNGAHRLKLPPSMSRLHPVFNVVKLMPAPSDPIPGRHPPPPPPPEIISGEEEWIVEEILDSKMINRKLRYLVKWEGFGIEHNSWEAWNDVHAPELLAKSGPLTSTPFLSVPFHLLCRVVTPLKGG